MCRVGRPLQVCRVEIPGEGGGMLLSKGQPPEDGIEYYGEGTEAGQCGVRIAKIKETHDGTFKCTLTPTDSRAEVQASVRIIVASKCNSNLVDFSFWKLVRGEYGNMKPCWEIGIPE